jgi:hypothetical protein
LAWWAISLSKTVNKQWIVFVSVTQINVNPIEITAIDVTPPTVEPLTVEQPDNGGTVVPEPSAIAVVDFSVKFILAY